MMNRKKRTFTLSLIASVTRDGLLTAECIEGGNTAQVFEHFMYHTIKMVYEKQLNKNR